VPEEEPVVSVEDELLGLELLLNVGVVVVSELLRLLLELLLLFWLLEPVAP